MGIITVMKKLFACVVALFAVLLLSTGSFILATFTLDGKYSVYNDNLPTEEYNLNPFSAYAETFLKSENGTSFRTNDPADGDKIAKILNAKKISEESIGDLKITYYYSPLLRRSVNIDGQKINLQITISADGVMTAGTPLILGSY